MSDTTCSAVTVLLSALFVAMMLIGLAMGLGDPPKPAVVPKPTPAQVLKSSTVEAYLKERNEMIRMYFELGAMVAKNKPMMSESVLPLIINMRTNALFDYGMFGPELNRVWIMCLMGNPSFAKRDFYDLAERMGFGVDKERASQLPDREEIELLDGVKALFKVIKIRVLTD